MQLERQRELFDNRSLARLILPLMVEQLLGMTIGMADTVMVSSLGEAAVSAVSLVDSINIILINIFSALATGGAVVASQYLGHQEPAKCRDSARQMYHMAFLVAMVIAAACLVLNRTVLTASFGHVERAVMDNAVTYFTLSALSYPFLAVYNAGAALFRAMGNSKISMKASILMNIVNIGGNAITIFGFGWGVAGAGLATLFSRALGAVLITCWISDRHLPIYLEKLHVFSFKRDMIGRILKIGVPSGLENGMFQLGKLLVVNLISTFGTSAIAANAISNTLANVAIVPGMAINLAIVPVVGQCMGAGDANQASRNIRKLMLLLTGLHAVTGILLAIFCGSLTGLFNLTEEATVMTIDILRMYGVLLPMFWAFSFTLPCALRGAGDARFTMVVAIVSMGVCRILCSYLFGQGMGMGLFGVWLAMIVDWLARGGFYGWRCLSGKWKTKKVI